MPWNRSKNCIPPKDTELQLFSNGKRWKAKLDIFEIVNGQGGFNPDVPEFWANLTDPDLPDPEPFKMKGIEHTDMTEKVIDEKVTPKLDPDGFMAPKHGFGVAGHDGFAKE